MDEPPRTLGVGRGRLAELPHLPLVGDERVDEREPEQRRGAAVVLVAPDLDVGEEDRLRPGRDLRLAVDPLHAQSRVEAVARGGDGRRIRARLLRDDEVDRHVDVVGIAHAREQTAAAVDPRVAARPRDERVAPGHEASSSRARLRARCRSTGEERLRRLVEEPQPQLAVDRRVDPAPDRRVAAARGHRGVELLARERGGVARRRPRPARRRRRSWAPGGGRRRPGRRRCRRERRRAGRDAARPAGGRRARSVWRAHPPAAASRPRSGCRPGAARAVSGPRRRSRLRTRTFSGRRRRAICRGRRRHLLSATPSRLSPASTSGLVSSQLRIRCPSVLSWPAELGW